MVKMTVTAEPGKHDMVGSCEFDAPRELVFAAYTDPRHIPHWWGPRRYSTDVDRMEVLAGGSWRFVQRDARNGNTFAFRGVYHDIVPAERIISTFEFEGMPGHVALETTVFETLPDGKTRITTTSVFQTVADRDGMMSSGMEEGAQETWDRFAELLTTLESAAL